MKRIICFIMVLTVAASVLLLAGCGEKDKKSDANSQKATTSATTAPTAKPAELSTLSASPIETLAPQDDDVSEAAQPTEDSTYSYYDSYGGLNGQEAILKALSFVGAGYQCVYYDQRYLQNQEAWYIGIQASVGNDQNVYYLYVNADSCVPVSEVPNIGGNNSENSGIFSEDFAGISEQEAIFWALDMVDGDNYCCVLSEQSELNGDDYWKIAIQEIDNPDGEIFTFYVNADSCIQQ